MCEENDHNWVFHGSKYNRYHDGNYGKYYEKTDTFYCSKCLQIKEMVIQKEHRMYNSIPSWWR